MEGRQKNSHFRPTKNKQTTVGVCTNRSNSIIRKHILNFSYCILLSSKQISQNSGGTSHVINSLVFGCFNDNFVACKHIGYFVSKLPPINMTHGIIGAWSIFFVLQD